MYIKYSMSVSKESLIKTNHPLACWCPQMTHSTVTVWHRFMKMSWRLSDYHTFKVHCGPLHLLACLHISFILFLVKRNVLIPSLCAGKYTKCSVTLVLLGIAIINCSVSPISDLRASLSCFGSIFILMGWKCIAWHFLRSVSMEAKRLACMGKSGK